MIDVQLSEGNKEDEKRIIACLSKAHDRDKVIQTFPEITKCAKMSRSRVKVALASLLAKGHVKSEDHNAIVAYYLKNRVTLK